MIRQRTFFNRPRLWGLLCGLTLAVAQFFSPASLGTAQAATTACCCPAWASGLVRN